MIVSVASLSRLQLKLVLDKLETSIIGQVALASNRKYRIKIVCAQGATDLSHIFDIYKTNNQYIIIYNCYEDKDKVPFSPL